MPSKYLRRDDQALHYVHTGPTTLPDRPPDTSHGACVVFLHGEGGSAALWSRQLAHFAAAHSALALDLPAHGRSSGLDGPPSIAVAAQVVADFLGGVDAPPAVLVGHGFGGHVALEVARSRPEGVRAVVTLGTAARAAIPDDAIDKLRQVVRGRLGQQFDTPYFGASPDMGLMREWWGELVKTDPKVRLSDLLAYRGSPLAEHLGRITRPVLVLVGEADRLCARAGAEELAGALRDARLESIADAGHALHLEKAAEVNAAIERFVRERATA
ncbi:alpha/beta fold hydrolase [Candidatus Binatia bacterium]|nr:alpha/beta fold hydrolase [Candidatus Binatia bacterium]